MNSRRIEIILIIAFLSLDVFLGMIVYDRYAAATSSTADTSVDVTDEMAANDINYPKFEEVERELPYIQADKNTLLQDNMETQNEQAGEFSDAGSLYVSILSNPIELSEGAELSNNDREVIQKFLKENVLFGSAYEYLDYFPSTQQIRFAQSIDGVPISDGSATVTFYFDSQWNIISYDQTYVGPVSEQGDKLRLITDKDAVEALFQNNYIPDKSSVAKPKLTYYRTLDLDDISLYVPTWYIKVTTNNNDAIYHVNAIDGSVLVTPSRNDDDDNKASESSSSAESEAKTSTAKQTMSVLKD